MGSRASIKRYPPWMRAGGYCKALIGPIPKWLRAIWHQQYRALEKRLVAADQDDTSIPPPNKVSNVGDYW